MLGKGWAFYSKRRVGGLDALWNEVEITAVDFIEGALFHPQNVLGTTEAFCPDPPAVHETEADVSERIVPLVLSFAVVVFAIDDQKVRQCFTAGIKLDA